MSKQNDRAETGRYNDLAWSGWLALGRLGRRGRRSKTEVATWLGKAESAAQPGSPMALRNACHSTSERTLITHHSSSPWQG